MSFALIAAADQENGIGKDNTMPWDIPADLKYFSKVTSGANVIMGRKTYESLPKAHRPLPNRTNIVLTRNSDYNLPKGVLKAESLDEALQIAKGDTFVIGGANVYAQAIKHLDCNKIYLTHIQGTHNSDAFFPEIDETIWEPISKSENLSENGHQFQFVVYEKRP
jgi:dihydrofolate reductase